MSGLSIRVGPNTDSLVLINPNDESKPLKINTVHFIGHVLVRVNNFKGQVPSGCKTISTIPYFKGRKRIHSIQIQGRFQKSWNMEDLVWSSDWDRPLVFDSFTSLFTKFWSMTDPGSRTDLKSAKPSVTSYLITAATAMEILQIDEKEETKPNDPGTFQKEIKEDIDAWLPSHLELDLEDTSLFGTMTEEAKRVAGRRRLFATEENRKQLVVGPQHILAIENFNPYFDPNTFKIKIPGVSLNMRKILNGQPFRMALRTRDKSVTFLVVEMLLATPDSDDDGVEEDDNPAHLVSGAWS